MRSMDNIRKELEKRREEVLLGGGQERIDKQHKDGKLTARERIDLLLDKGTFVELDRFVTHRCTDFGMENKKFWGDGVVTGYGKIDEGLEGLVGFGYIFLRNVLASGVIPQISAIMGPCAGGAVYSPAMTDFILMTQKTSYLHITGPDVIRAALGKTETPDGKPITSELLGGSKVHMEKSGVAHFAGESDKDTVRLVRELLRFLPQNNREKPPVITCTDDPKRMEKSLKTVIPDSSRNAYNMKEIILAVADHAYFLEVKTDYARKVVVVFR